MSGTKAGQNVWRLRQARTIAMPAHDCQASNDEREEAIDMPGADIETMRSVFFRPIQTAE